MCDGGGGGGGPAGALPGTSFPRVWGLTGATLRAGAGPESGNAGSGMPSGVYPLGANGCVTALGDAVGVAAAFREGAAVGVAVAALGFGVWLGRAVEPVGCGVAVGVEGITILDGVGVAGGRRHGWTRRR